jgi:two-component system chemotaxis sensor kinase CheA
MPDEVVVSSLKRIAEEIENASLSDRAAWSAIKTGLTDVLSKAHDLPSRVKESLQLSIRGLAFLADGREKERGVAVMAAVAVVTDHAVSLLEKGEGPGLDFPTKETELLSSLPGELSRSQIIEEINDVASLVVQTDPNDPEAVKLLCEALKSASGNMPQDLRDVMEETVKELSSPEAAKGAQDILARLGDVLEAAVEIFSGPEPVGKEAHDADAETPSEVPQEQGGKNYMPEDADPDLILEFVTESSELIANAEEALLTLETNPEDMEAVGMIFRAFHTVKGTSAFLNLTLVSEMGHFAESLLSRVRDGEIHYGGGYADLALKALDMLKELVQRVKAALGGAALEKPDGYDRLLEILKDPEAHGFSEDAGTVEPMAAVPRLGDILVAEGKADRHKVEEVAAAAGKRQIAGRLVEMGVAPLPDVAQALRTQQQLLKSAKVVSDSSVRVSTSRLDRLVDMVGELVIAYSMVAQDQTVSGSSDRELSKKVSHASKIIRELQDLSMSMRMVPLKPTFSKMARLVRDLGRKVGKNVNLISEGEDTEIDRNMVDIINDPLVHMVRNAIDHGIEPPQERIKAGKPEQGTVWLSAYHTSGNVVVEVRDDGKGLDKEAILEKGRRQGLIPEGVVPPEREIFNLIFEPGFSTAKVVTEVSGRGVGMDVVKKNIERLRGQVDIHSTPGKGSVFRISLPLTLAIIDGMVIRIGSERYVVPTASIVRAVKPSGSEIFTVSGKGEMISLNNELMPLFRLADLYQIADGVRDPCSGLVVVIEEESSRVGLLIDELIGRQQIVIKSLGEALRNIPGISGGAIMPSGTVGLILDVNGLVRLATGEEKSGGDGTQ